VSLTRPGSEPLGIAITLADAWERESLWPSVMDDRWEDYCAAK
jgi:hypothetical protein